MRALAIQCVGTPIPQGSKVANRHAPGVRDANARKLKPWRAKLAAAARAAAHADGWETLDGPIRVTIKTAHPRPAAHYRTGRYSGLLKPDAPRWKATRPDVDKLARAVLDALTDAQVITDDGRVAWLSAYDMWTNDPDNDGGVLVYVTPLTDGVEYHAKLAAVHDSGDPAGVIL